MSAASKTNLYNVRAVRGGLQAAPNCPATPATNCSAAATNMVRFAETKTSRLQWRWSEGASAMIQSDFGNPLTTTAYTLCLYDEAGGSAVFKRVRRFRPRARAAQTVLAGAVHYRLTLRDSAASNDGIKTVTLKGGIAGKPLHQDYRSGSESSAALALQR